MPVNIVLFKFNVPKAADFIEIRRFWHVEFSALNRFFDFADNFQYRCFAFDHIFGDNQFIETFFYCNRGTLSNTMGFIPKNTSPRIVNAELFKNYERYEFSHPLSARYQIENIFD